MSDFTGDQKNAHDQLNENDGDIFAYPVNKYVKIF